MQDSVAYGPLALEAASRAGLAVVVAELAPPRIVYASESVPALFGVSPSVVLPIDDAGAVVEPSVVESTTRPARRRRILIVDDEPAIGRTLRALLTPLHDVVVANGGLEAAALLEAAGPAFDVVLCDITMPDLSGVALFQQVCKLRPELEQRFVFMTGGMFRDDILAPYGAAAAPRLEKPFGLGELGAIIERITG